MSSQNSLSLQCSGTRLNDFGHVVFSCQTVIDQDAEDDETVNSGDANQCWWCNDGLSTCDSPSEDNFKSFLPIQLQVV